MDKRFLIALAGLLLVAGGGYAWLWFQIRKRKTFLKNLLSLPKESRFFCYLLRKAGFRIRDIGASGGFEVLADGKPLTLGARCDFLASKSGKTWACAVTGTEDPRDLARLYLTYRAAFGSVGTVFYHPFERRMTVWEGER